jgi:hypothetical protein
MGRRTGLGEVNREANDQGDRRADESFAGE